jgi:hypothetical protein
MARDVHYSAGCFLSYILLIVLLIAFFDRTFKSAPPGCGPSEPEIVHHSSYQPHKCIPVENSRLYIYQTEILVNLSIALGHQSLTAFHINDPYCYFVTRSVNGHWTAIFNPKFIKGDSYTRVYQPEPLCRHKLQLKYPSTCTFEGQLNFSQLTSTIICKNVSCSAPLARSWSILNGELKCPR